jgi:hypothetical protein
MLPTNSMVSFPVKAGIQYPQRLLGLLDRPLSRAMTRQ